MSSLGLTAVGFSLPVAIIALGMASGNDRRRASLAGLLAAILVSVRYQPDRAELAALLSLLYFFMTRFRGHNRTRESEGQAEGPSIVYASSTSNRAVLAAGILVVGMGIVDGLAAGFRPYQAATSVVLIGLLLLLARDLRRGIAFAQTVADSVSIFGLMLLAGTINAPVFIDCNLTFDKCSIFGQLYTGRLVSENSVGLASSILLAVLLSNWGRLDHQLRLAAVPIAISLLASGSRTAMFSILVGVAVALAVGASMMLRIYGRPAIRVFVALCVVVPGIWLVWNSDGDDFSRRGQIWSSALDQLGGFRLLGLGEQTWSLSQDAGLLPPSHYPHSQTLLLLYFGGAWAVAVYAWLISQVALPECGGRWAALGASVFGVAGLTEVVWDPTGFDIGFWMLLILVCSTCLPGPKTVERSSVVLSDATIDFHREVGD